MESNKLKRDLLSDNYTFRKRNVLKKKENGTGRVMRAVKYTEVSWSLLVIEKI